MLTLNRVQQLLRLAYAHVQMMLYRPFLHYVSNKSGRNKTIDERSYACAAACVSVSRNVVHICTEMKKRGLLIGAYWFTMYTTFFSILSLVFFVLENPDKPGSQEILADANDGKDTLNGLAQRSQAADRCSVVLRVSQTNLHKHTLCLLADLTLKNLFEKLPERLKNGHAPALVTQTKKRSAPFPNSVKARGVQSSPDLSQPVTNMGLSPGAPAFLVPTLIQTSNSQRTSLDSNRFQVNTSSTPNLRQSFHELLSPADLSAAGTPESSGTASVMHDTQYSIPQHFDSSSSLPDLGAMMFPSADPFAYPNQPMMQYENIKQEGGLGIANDPQMFMPLDDLEGILYGPVPPYMNQGQQNLDLRSQFGAGNVVGGLDQNLLYQSNVLPSGELSSNIDIFGDSGGWGCVNGEERYQ